MIEEFAVPALEVSVELESFGIEIRFAVDIHEVRDRPEAAEYDPQVIQADIQADRLPEQHEHLLSGRGLHPCSPLGVPCKSSARTAEEYADEYLFVQPALGNHEPVCQTTRAWLTICKSVINLRKKRSRFNPGFAQKPPVHILQLPLQIDGVHVEVRFVVRFHQVCNRIEATNHDPEVVYADTEEQGLAQYLQLLPGLSNVAHESSSNGLAQNDGCDGRDASWPAIEYH
jgi:hypothetical protein